MYRSQTKQKGKEIKYFLYVLSPGKTKKEHNKVYFYMCGVQAKQK